jgi:hypothetical protein
MMLIEEQETAPTKLKTDSMFSTNMAIKTIPIKLAAV